MKKREMKRKIFKKLTNARRAFKKQGIQATGENKFNNFKYITLEDIVNSAIDVLAENDLCIHQKFYLNPPIVELVDLETGYTETFGSRLTFEPDGKNTNQRLQGLGSTETYLRRYIYLQILDIVECDPDKNFGKNLNQHVLIGNQDVLKRETTKKEQATGISEKEMKKILDSSYGKRAAKKEQVTEISEKEIKEILDRAYEKVTNAGKDFTIENARFTIKRLAKSDALYEKCMETLQYKGRK